MTVKEYASKYELSVSLLGKITGLSRQGLNDIIVKRYTAKDSKKRHEAAEKLQEMARKDWARKVTEAEVEYEERIKLSHLLYNI